MFAVLRSSPTSHGGSAGSWHNPTSTFHHLHILRLNTEALWMHSRTVSESQISSSGSSLSGGQMRERPPYCKEFATPWIVQRSTGTIDRELAIEYVLATSGPSDLIIFPDSTRPYNRGWAGLFLLVASNNVVPACSVARITSRTNSPFQATTVMFSMTLADSSGAV